MKTCYGNLLENVYLKDRDGRWNDEINEYRGESVCEDGKWMELGWGHVRW
jgi:hypothetical protein